MKKSVLVCRAVFPDVLERLAEHFDLETNQDDVVWSREELIAHLQGKAGVFVTGTQPIDSALLDACPELKAVCSMAVGYNNIDVPACTARGVLVSNAPDVLTETTADFGFALMMATARRISESEHFLRSGQWTKWSVDAFAGSDVHSATLGVLGMGRIGQAIAHRAAAFNMEIAYTSRSPRPNLNYTYYPDAASLAAIVDFLIVITPGGAGTRGMIDARVLKALGPDGYLINVARGSVVDQPALIDALRDGVIAGAGLDVFVNEPNVPEELRAMPNVVLTPHIGSGTKQTREAMGQLTFDNLRAHFAGKPLLTPVDA